MKTSDILNTSTFECFGLADKVLIGIAMKEYAKAKCKEQREICSETDNRRNMSYHDMAEWAIRENIKDSPEPNFD